MRLLACLLVIATAFAVSCIEKEESQDKTKGEEIVGITVTSDAFTEGSMIPMQYTCDGADISPPLKWSGIPDGAKSLALICDDPDAPSKTWVHWVLYNLPPDLTGLPDSISSNEVLDKGARHGITDFGRFGYGGPCPPSGVHRYFFKLYAVDTMLDLSGRVDKEQLEAAMEGHVLASGQLMGTYTRQ
jgi:Raf kinase inhibitor-like YbhB/YbcL family protein